MKPKKQIKDSDLESVKIRREVVNLVREHKKKTRFPIGAFIELAITEKLSNLSTQQ